MDIKEGIQKIEQLLWEFSRLPLELRLELLNEMEDRAVKASAALLAEDDTEEDDNDLDVNIDWYSDEE